MFADYYSGKRVLVTGHTGFKGGWASFWLHKLGAEVHGLSLLPPTHPNLHEVIRAGTFASEVNCDIREPAPLAKAVERIRPEIVFHLAAQPIVRRSYTDPLETLETNALGTAHLLEAARHAGLSGPIVVVTSDKCYENREWDYAYREDDPLGGHDIYSMSKAATELVAQAWNRSFFAPAEQLGPVATARAGNVIGGGDYAQDRIVPDAVRALSEGRPILVRNPAAVRPWQHVLESLSGYLWLGARLGLEGKSSPLVGAFNFGPDPSARQPVRLLVEEMLKHWPGEWTDGSDPRSPHEANMLTLAIDKAAAKLDWRPVWSFSDSVRQTIEWYKARHTGNGADMDAVTGTQIDGYTEAARNLGLAWTN